MRNRFDDIGRHEHLEAEQERPTDADLIDLGVLLRYRLPQLAIGRPYDTDHDDENAEDFDPAPDDADEVIDRRFEALDRVLHLRAPTAAGAQPIITIGSGNCSGARPGLLAVAAAARDNGPALSSVAPSRHAGASIECPLSGAKQTSNVECTPWGGQV